jgi:hypothetical protein
MSNRWSDDFLNSMRDCGDPLADDYLAKLIADNEIADMHFLFRQLNTNDEVPVHELEPAFSDFYQATHKLPAGTDLDRIDRGEQAFQKYAFPAALVLLTKSLSEGYAAPGLTRILNISQNLERKPYRRLLQVLQMLLNVSAIHGFEHGGRAIISAQKLRMLHAGIRYVADRHVPEYRKSFGVPVNHEDMMATILGFSLLVVDGLAELECPFTDEEAEDYYYLWKVYALMMGIHPKGEPDSFANIPDDLQDARRFYAAYGRRHYTDAKSNPDGVELVAANLDMLKDMIPLPLRFLGFGFAPRVYTQSLIGRDACSRVGLKPLPGHALFKWFLLTLPRTWMHLYARLFHKMRPGHSTAHHYLGEIVFGNMIQKKFGHEITFTVPVTIEQMRAMVLD